MSTNLYDAHRQWVTRPPDERFTSLEALYEFTKARKKASTENKRPLRDLGLVATPDGAIAVNGNDAPAYLSHWAFGQLCVLLGAPAKYLRSLPPEMVRDCLQYGLNKSEQECKLLFRDSSHSNGGESPRWTAALTGPSYGRIWDADVLESLMEAVEGTDWHLPPSDNPFSSEPSGLYASDRDMFVFMINDQNPVTIGNARLGRGFFCWNSETGSATFGLTTFLYNYVCGNHIVWGAEQVRELRIVHRNHAPDRFYREALPLLNRLVENREQSENVRSTVERAMDARIGSSLDDVLDWFKLKPFTKAEVTKAWEIGLAEHEDVTTLWGMIQGLTAYSKCLPHVDARVSLERRAGALLA